MEGLPGSTERNKRLFHVLQKGVHFVIHSLTSLCFLGMCGTSPGTEDFSIHLADMAVLSEPGAADGNSLVGALWCLVAACCYLWHQLPGTGQLFQKRKRFYHTPILSLLSPLPRFPHLR